MAEDIELEDSRMRTDGCTELLVFLYIHFSFLIWALCVIVVLWRCVSMISVNQEKILVIHCQFGPSDVKVYPVWHFKPERMRKQTIGKQISRVHIESESRILCQLIQKNEMHTADLAKYFQPQRLNSIFVGLMGVPCMRTAVEYDMTQHAQATDLHLSISDMTQTYKPTTSR